MPLRPECTTQYIEDDFVDSGRWKHFIHRGGDVFVSTPPKCGTTWMQAICVMLVQGTGDIEGRLGDISPWLDRTSSPIADVTARLEAQHRRRVIKTHTPLDGFPY